MSIFNAITWKMIARLMPAVVELVRDAKGGGHELSDMRQKVEHLEQLQKAMKSRMQLLLGGFITTLSLAVAALIVALIALSRSI